jgi:membrane-bound lytic murein transglycosylase D
MDDNGVPAECALLPLVESSYENARSSAAAVGIWQFTRATGRDYLRVSAGSDERLDPVKSAQAAAKLLKEKGKGRVLISVCTAGGMGVTAIVER